MDKKDPAFKFKMNIPVKVSFQSNVVKEGDGEFGHWKMYKIQVDAKDYILFPSKGLQDRLDQIGDLTGRVLQIGKFESDKQKTFWEILDEKGLPVDYNPSKTTYTHKTSQNANSGLTGDTVDKIRNAFKALELRVCVLEAEIKELRK